MELKEVRIQYALGTLDYKTIENMSLSVYCDDNILKYFVNNTNLKGFISQNAQNTFKMKHPKLDNQYY